MLSQRGVKILTRLSRASSRSSLAIALLKINLWLALTINCCVRKKLTEFISDAFVHHLLKLGENWPWDDSGLVLWHIRRKRKYLLFNVWTVWDIKHMNMATSLIQRHKLKIKTQSTKNLSAAIQQTKCSDCLQRLVSWDGCRAHPALSYSSNIDCWNDQISRNIPEKDRRGVTIKLGISKHVERSRQQS